ncbi:class I SAM-dependent methyltransferase [Pseudalkalibacillus hwajinpoensis]|uniref:class I SAM-dependent methyltransferase n=1 Tax=Guptibacillus hwajinpoensis TaxID=208199 RepID=UPI00325AD61D
MPDQKENVILQLSSALNNYNIPYFFINETALWLQGALTELDSIAISVQWDGFESVTKELNNRYGGSIPIHSTDRSCVVYEIDGYMVNVECTYNTVVRTNPYLIEVPFNDHTIPCLSLYYYQPFPKWTKIVNEHLKTMQDNMTEQNQVSWNQQNYEALLNRFGSPQEAAVKLKENPTGRLKSLIPYLPPLEGKQVANLMGSHGMKATSMGLLGADVTVIDFSYENERYAKELAVASGVTISYYVSDILKLGPEHNGKFDVVVMELGILHYFLDLHPLFKVVKRLLSPEGTFILQDFHPVSTKLITSKGKKHKVDGNYFDPSIHKIGVAYEKHLSSEDGNVVLQRKWTLGEVLTSMADESLIIRQVVEEPNIKLNDRGIPKVFTVKAMKQ